MDDLDTEKGTNPETLNAPSPDSISASGRRSEALAFVWEVVKVVILSLAIIVPIRYYLVQPFFVKGASMEPTFDDGNYILIDEISYRFHHPARGDIVVFRYPNDTTQFFIKRVIALPSETIEIKDDHITVYPVGDSKGHTLDEPYLASYQHTVGNYRMRLDDNEYFVLGDNRLRSSDSRFWGPVNRSLITGRVFFRAFPLNEFGNFPEVKY